MAEKIRKRIAQAHLDVDEETVAMQASVGGCQLRPDEALDQAIQRADGGWYQAKQGGRDQLGVAWAAQLVQCKEQKLSPSRRPRS